MKNVAREATNGVIYGECGEIVKNGLRVVCPHCGEIGLYPGHGGSVNIWTVGAICLPCFLELKKAGKHDITRIAGGKNLKITCWRCKRRRYGAEYEISRKGGARRDSE